MDDLRPATTELTRLVRGVRDDQLTAPTPCPDYTLGDLLDHVHALATGFAVAARKEDLPPGFAPSGDAARLPEDWRDEIERLLTGLADAWADLGAWEGDATVAGCAACVAMLTSEEFAAQRGHAGFAAPVVVPSDAGALDRLVATNGRDPAGYLRSARP